MNYLKIAQSWLDKSYDIETREQVKKMINNDLKELEDSFYRNLEFGTGGLRGVMGVGTNRMNRYTVGMATQGLVNYMKHSFKGKRHLSVAIAFDNRNNSRYFARITADVFAANGFVVYLFDELRPTPELSFAIRHLDCAGGVMITASHNPKEYNGYKAYWSDGAQITAPHDVNIIDEVLKIEKISQVKFSGGEQNIKHIGKDMDELYLNAILSLTLSPDIVKDHNSFKIVYTPLHGTGVKIVPEALKRLGFNNVINIPEQDVTDGDFPTISSPNPEEPSALKMAMEKAAEVQADLVMATDPDADRLGIAVRDNEGRLILLNGNQTAAILTYYLLARWKETGRLKDGPNNKKYYMVKTIVTSDLLKSIADKFQVDMYNVLTGFKYIAEVVKENEGKREFIGGGEESYGFNAGEFVRDKDAVISCCLVAEAAAWAASKGKTLYEMLLDIYIEFGFYKERLISVTKKGKDGLEQIQNMMRSFREMPLQTLAGSPVVLVHDYKLSETFDMISDLRYKINLPKSNVLQYISRDNSVVSVRPSGTEPKIKFYFGVRGTLNNRDEFVQTDEALNKHLDKLTEQMMQL
ncbi:MAG: phosphoglucomutase [Bacteroidetes bacterium GWF2_40_14]|nr:MAG: phosphoglucomutase [Bacteroidetes bacterium GWF2_40_14]